MDLVIHGGSWNRSPWILRAHCTHCIQNARKGEWSCSERSSGLGSCLLFLPSQCDFTFSFLFHGLLWGPHQALSLSN